MSQINADRASIPHTAAWLGGFGLLPFAAGAVMSNIAVTADFGHWFIIGYGAIILSFLGGIQWGIALCADRPGSIAYVVSIIISLIGWAATFLAPPLSFIVLAAGFLAALAFDALATVLFGLPGWFLRLRFMLSLGVLTALGIAAMPLLN